MLNIGQHPSEGSWTEGGNTEGPFVHLLDQLNCPGAHSQLVTLLQLEYYDVLHYVHKSTCHSKGDNACYKHPSQPQLIRGHSSCFSLTHSGDQACDLEQLDKFLVVLVDFSNMFLRLKHDVDRGSRISERVREAR